MISPISLPQAVPSPIPEKPLPAAALALALYVARFVPRVTRLVPRAARLAALVIACLTMRFGWPSVVSAAETIRPVPFTQVQIVAGFWKPRFDVNRQTTVWYDFRKCEETGRIDNFAKAGGLMPGEFEGIYFNDSDVYKVIEGACYALATHPDPKLDAYLDALIAKIAAAQEPDGYLYTCRTLGAESKQPAAGKTRWSHLAHSHELYNVGHLYEAAVAHFQATGKRSLLDVAIKNAELICRTFGPDKRHDVPGHEEIEIGLVKLYQATGRRKYLELAQFFVDQRGRPEGRKLYGIYLQDHLPVTQQHEAVGHAVRAMYLYTAMADLAALASRDDYLEPLDRLWNNVVGRKMYLTGGVGARRVGEAFGDDYELPNRTAYCETCAAVGNAFWNQRMFLLHGEAKYIDVLERVIYNGFLSGVALSGDRFFYPNPLEHDGKTPFNHGHTGRSPWFGTSCCPVNIVRFIPSMAGYIYAQADRSIYVNLFVDSKASIPLDGQTVSLTQQTRYPWDERITLRVDVQRPTELTLRIRIPGWVRNEPVPSDLYRFVRPRSTPPEITINGQAVDAIRIEQGYAVLQRRWSSGDVVELRLPMPVRRVVAHDRVAADRQRVAIQRGPIVYCVEACDHPADVRRMVLPDDAPLTAEYRDDLLGGITIVQAAAHVPVDSDNANATKQQPVRLQAIPYYAWAHREPGAMTVWLHRGKTSP